MHDSGDLVQALLRHDLVDEWQLITFTVVLGSGSGCSPTARCRARCDW